ncbi:MAG: hypothetical protein EPN20_18825 [Magnetospirillum sp.]|nr:MAG: hypothetical protein EPN20_18825 [Magnetospirillum sp.]
MPKSYLSEERKQGLSQNALYAAESGAARRAGDEEAAWAWLRLAEIPAHALLALKRVEGADYIRKIGLRTETAEKTYGKDWLDRNI